MKCAVHEKSSNSCKFIHLNSVQTAAHCALCNPAIKTLCIAGPTGTAKTAFARCLSNNSQLNNALFLNSSMCEEGIFGHIAIEESISLNRPIFKQGLISRAHKGILVADTIENIQPHILKSVVNSAHEGTLRIERDSYSKTIQTDFTLIALLTSDRILYSQTILDDFDLFVATETITSVDDRCEMIHCNCFSENDKRSSKGAMKEFTYSENSVQEIAIDSADLRYVCEKISEAGIKNHRCDIATVECAKSLAWLNKRKKVSWADIHQSLSMTTVHRIPKGEAQIQPKAASPQSDIHGGNDAKDNKSKNSNSNGKCQGDDNPETNPLAKTNNDKQKTIHDTGIIGKEISTPHLLTDVFNRNKTVGGSGRRMRVRSDSRKGRYVRNRIPSKPTRDIAIDATLRAAAPFQAIRKNSTLKNIVITPRDIREKVRECRTGAFILFVVDASTSMGLSRRIEAARGACLSLLKQAYEKRDTIAFMTFYDTHMDVILPPTRSVELAHKLLPTIRVGGKTPIAQAVQSALTYVLGMRARSDAIVPVIALFSDFRPTQSLQDNDPVKEMFKQAYKASHEKISFFVFDTECGFVRLGYGQKFAKIVNGTYVHINDTHLDKIDNLIYCKSKQGGTQ